MLLQSGVYSQAKMARPNDHRQSLMLSQEQKEEIAEVFHTVSISPSCAYFISSQKQEYESFSSYPLKTVTPSASVSASLSHSLLGRRVHDTH